MRAPPRDHREHGRRAIARLAHEALVLVALRGLRQLELVGQILDHARPAARQHARHRVVARGVQRSLLAQSLHAPGNVAVGRRGDRLDDRAVAVDQVDHAQLREVRHGGAREVAQRLRRVQRGVERSRSVDQEFQAPAMLANAVQRQVDDDVGEQRQHDADARDRSEDLGHGFVGERQQEGHQRGEQHEDEASTRLKAGGVTGREQVDQGERAARSSRRRAQDRDQHDAPQIAGERQRETAPFVFRRDREPDGDHLRAHANRGDRHGRPYVRDQQCRRAQQPPNHVQARLRQDRRTDFPSAQGRLPCKLDARSAPGNHAGLSHPVLPNEPITRAPSPQRRAIVYCSPLIVGGRQPVRGECTGACAIVKRRSRAPAQARDRPAGRFGIVRPAGCSAGDAQAAPDARFAAEVGDVGSVGPCRGQAV